MRESPYFAVTVVTCHLLLGLTVFLTNPRRSINRSFLLLALIIGVWVSGIEFVFVADSAARVAFWLRVCSVAGVLAPPAFVMLRMSIVHYDEPWLRQVSRTSKWWGLGIVAALFCTSPLYLVRVDFIPSLTNATIMVPKPVYTPSVYLLYAYLLSSVLVITWTLVRDQIRPDAIGVHKVELQFIWLAWVTMVATVFLAVFLQVVQHGFQLTRYTAPLRVIIFDTIIAYGISSRGILQVRSVLRRGLSYLLLTAYAAVIYAILWVTMRWIFLHLGEGSTFWPSVLSGGLAALLVNSLVSPFRSVARRILPSNDMDFENIFGQVRNHLQSVTTLQDLIEGFSETLGPAIGAESVRVLLPDVTGFCELDVQHDSQASRPAGSSGLCLAENDVIVRSLRAGAPDLAVEELARHASTPDQRSLLGRLVAIESDLIVPALYRGQLSAILVLSPRIGGRIYGVDGRSTLRWIAEQLGIAIVNAHLYTEAYRSQAYNRLLVEHLPCGVISVDPNGAVRLINPEARRLLQVDEAVPAEEVELPISFGELIRPTLQEQTETAPEEIVLRTGARDQTHLRVHCLPLEGETGEPTGAVLVLNDHTTLERLQRQVRQADRLASIGTLASGMAHEIKNPLTALKTFTQLLPKRYNDAEFRHDFSGLAGSEIARIERIVNQLLAFARPAPLMIEQVNLHEIVSNALKLVGPQASRHGVELRLSLNAEADYIAADKDRLQQVLLNLLLNALQASPDGGWIEVTSELEAATADQESFIKLNVRDAGSGIPKEILPHIFDPFFTTKGEGTGLGLSVSYNIVTEHKGRLEVESETGKGTCFSLFLPVC